MLTLGRVLLSSENQVSTSVPELPPMKGIPTLWPRSTGSYICGSERL